MEPECAGMILVDTADLYVLTDDSGVNSSWIMSLRWVHMRHFSLPTWTAAVEVCKGVHGFDLQWIKLHVTLKPRLTPLKLMFPVESDLSGWEGSISNTLWWCDRCDSDQCVFEATCLIYKWNRTLLNSFAWEDVKNLWSWTQKSSDCRQTLTSWCSQSTASAWMFNSC